jgi:AraC-like DNA-binding protein
MPLHVAEVFSCGYERRARPEKYDWDGLKRDSDPSRPFAVFQWTRRGEGALSMGGQTHRMPAGAAFWVTVPGPHRYCLPPDSPMWEFLYLVIWQPEIVARGAAVSRRYGPVFRLRETMMLAPRLERLLRDVAMARCLDAWEIEARLYGWVTDLERALITSATPDLPSRRGRLAERLENWWRDSPGRRAPIAAFAASIGLSRTHFYHRFRAQTGVGPIAFLQECRLKRAGERLVQTHDKLDAIARETGFGSASKLCSAFKRRYGLPPAAFRRSIRG